MQVMSQLGIARLLCLMPEPFDRACGLRLGDGYSPKRGRSRAWKVLACCVTVAWCAVHRAPELVSPAIA